MNLEEALMQLSAPDLKQLSKLIHGTPASGRKADLAGFIHKHLSIDVELLKSLWSQLETIDQLAVAETLHNSFGNVFDAPRFRAKYDGMQPSRAPGGSPTALALFLYPTDKGSHLPTDLARMLQTFVPVPEDRPLASSVALIESSEPLTVRETEAEALVDVGTVLQLIGAGKIKVGPKTGHPNGASVDLLTASLANQDFYPPDRDALPEDRIGPIKAFAWPLLMQAGKLASINAGRLQLTRNGTKALGQPPHDTINTLWQRWVSTTLLDEFSRVDAIKGQRAKGRNMTAIAERREIIEAALTECPVGEWVSLDEFSRFMRAEDYLFEITHDPWKLYISESGYGSLGYGGSHGWNILQERYLRAVLFEYAATLGMIDVAYLHPADVPIDYSELWGTDHLAFLSRYDGLQQFRLTPLGAFCLGGSESFAATPRPAGIRLSVLPSLRLQIRSGTPDAQERLTLDTWARQEADDTWLLTRDHLLDAIERGLDIGELRTFLEARDDQPLPEPVEAFIETTTVAARALRPMGQVLLLSCSTADIAAMIASDPKTSSLCRRADEHTLIIEPGKEARFRKAVRKLGLGFAPQ
ncbi:MAG: hypothetical protein JJU22_12425 [Gammaproteobacteria bacterium]|nr:hypothetical protein [Gammaproteobacteria bacterium]